MPQTFSVNEQVMEIEVAGPDGANRLFICAGVAGISLFVSSGQSKTETWRWLVGPELPRPQFHRAIAQASVGDGSMNIQGPPSQRNVSILSVDADWDDESGRVEARAEIQANATGLTLNLNQISFSVYVLAEV